MAKTLYQTQLALKASNIEKADTGVTLYRYTQSGQLIRRSRKEISHLNKLLAQS
jgi:uncharacterized C2H2 Zn-finger protein